MEQDYFADGMVEDIITGLSRIKWLFVIARNSSFAYKGKAVNVKQAGRELGVRYILEGSVRKASSRVRVTGQLIEAETGRHVWADRYDRTLDDIFAIQDELTMSVVAAIEPSLRQAEIERVKRKRPDSLDAYDLVLRALPHVYTADAGGGREGAAAARERAQKWNLTMRSHMGSLLGHMRSSSLAAARTKRTASERSATPMRRSLMVATMPSRCRSEALLWGLWRTTAKQRTKPSKRRWR